QAGLKKELQDLGLRAPENTCAVIRDVLLRVGRTGSRVGELRARGLGRPSSGGQMLPATGNAFMTSEYLHQCLGTFLAGQGLWAEDEDECALSADVGIRGCPDGGKREWAGDMGNMSLMWDNGPAHRPTTPNCVTP